MKTPLRPMGRRSFVTGALMAAGGAAGWLFRKTQRATERQASPSRELGNRFVYDVSEFEKIDPALISFRPDGEFPTGFRRARRLAASADGGVWVAGDRSARLFDRAGGLIREIQLDAFPHALREVEGGELLVAFARGFERFDAFGKRRFRSESVGGKSFLTAIAVHAQLAYVADAGEREVVICDGESGSVIDRFGKRDSARGNPGFKVPSPYFDVAIAGDVLLRIVNPSRLRIETYSLDGQFRSAWGKAGLQVDRFSGCCNPVYFGLSPDGDFITSEKGIARIKVYGPEGEFKGVVAGPEELVEDKALAKRACEDCSVGGGFDVTLDRAGRVLALDPYRKVVRVFTSSREVTT